jgi:hypothetical protein
MSIDKQLKNEEDILESQLNDGAISLDEYNHQLLELEREAREYAREENNSLYDEWCNRH